MHIRTAFQGRTRRKLIAQGANLPCLFHGAFPMEHFFMGKLPISTHSSIRMHTYALTTKDTASRSPSRQQPSYKQDAAPPRPEQP